MSPSSMGSDVRHPDPGTTADGLLESGSLGDPLSYQFTPDDGREERCGFPEVIFGQGKDASQIVGIAKRILEKADRLLVTRADQAKAETLIAAIDDGWYLPRSRTIIVDRTSGGMFDGVDRCELAQLDESRQVAHLLEGGVGNTIVACAGTSDLFAAEEAAVTARIAGSSVTLITDIGIAGIHRTLAHESELRSARAIAVAAGMEGALPSVIAGLVDVPVIAIPTSVGYGASLGGIAALLGMLNSCAGGVSVVNIDNGFGAGQILDRINRPPARFAGVR